MNDNKDYMDIFKEKQVNINNIETKPEEKKEEVNESDLLPMYSDRLSESEKLFDPLGNHPLPNGEKVEVEEVKEEVKEEKKVEPVVEVKKEEPVEEELGSLSELDLEKASKSMTVDIIGNKSLDKVSLVLFIIILLSIILHSLLTYNEYLKGLDTTSIVFISVIYLFMLITLILSKKKRKSTVVFSYILVLLLFISIFKLNIVSALIGFVILIPTILYTKAINKK